MMRKIYRLSAVALLAACGADAPPSSSGDDAPGDAIASGSSVTTGPAVVFLGTSLTAGLGVDPDSAFPALLQSKIDSAGWVFRVVNAGVSGETSAGGLRRVDWLLRDSVAVMVLELGANDGLRGLGIEQLTDNLDEIVRRTRAAHPDARVIIAGMQAPPDLGPRYTVEFRDAFAVLAERHGTVLIPFLLEGVGGEPSMNQEDGIHPTVAGHVVIAETVWRALAPVLREVAGR